MASAQAPSLEEEKPYTRMRTEVDGKLYFSYADVHEACSSCIDAIKAFNPDVIVAIGGGGFIPARMIRTELKTVPILAVSLELYDDKTDTARTEVKKNQWFTEEPGECARSLLARLLASCFAPILTAPIPVAGTYGAIPRGRRCLIVDEVDDSRRTLEYAVKTLQETNEPSAIGAFVVHNKKKPKRGSLPANVEYFVGEEVEDAWVAYPWDAAKYKGSIREHERKARICSGKAAPSKGSVFIFFLVAVGLPVLYFTTALVTPYGSAPPPPKRGWW